MKGKYISVWNGRVEVTSDIEIDIDNRTIEFIKEPGKAAGMRTAEYIKYVKNKKEIEMPACQEDERKHKLNPSIYYTYE